MNDPTWRVTCGDARELDLPDESVHAILTSVPYWGLRKYSDSSLEIGREDTLQEWVDNLVKCAQEWRRCLYPTGTLWINVGDAYAGSWGNYNPTGQGGQRAKSTERYIRPAWEDTNYRPPASCPQGSLKPKDIIDLPGELARALRADGWFWRQKIVWAKGVDWLPQERKAQDDIRKALAEVRASAAGSLFGLSTELDRTIKKAERAVDRIMMSGAVMPESVRDRCSSSFEMVFMFSKLPRYFFDQEAIKVRACVSRPDHLRRFLNGDTATLSRADRGFPGQPDRQNCIGLWNQNNPTSRNPRNVWMFWRVGTSPSGTYVLSSGEEVSHFASWPTALAERIIKCSTSEAGVCKSCGSPFVRMIEKTGHVNRREPAHVPGNAATKTDSTGWAPTTRATSRFIPTCTCYSSPVRGLVMCKKCKGSGQDSICQVAKRSLLAGEMVTHQPSPVSTAPKILTGSPCPTCSGSGTIPGDIWPDDVLAAWPRIPCTVLDPMAGSGVTGRAAFNLGRSVILNDLHPQYCQLMRERMSAYPGDVLRKGRSRENNE